MGIETHHNHAFYGNIFTCDVTKYISIEIKYYKSQH